MANLILKIGPAALRAKSNGQSIQRILFIEIALLGHTRSHATSVNCCGLASKYSASYERVGDEQWGEEFGQIVGPLFAQFTF